MIAFAKVWYIIYKEASLQTFSFRGKENEEKHK